MIKLNFIVQFAEPKDIKSLHLGDKLANATFWSEESYLSTLNNIQYKVYVAKLQQDEVASTLIGALVVSITDYTAEILQLWVLPQYRRCKIAISLLDKFFFDIKNNLKIEDVFLEVSSDNYLALALYDKLGFCKVGTRKNYYFIDGRYKDALVMKLNFASLRIKDCITNEKK